MSEVRQSEKLIHADKSETVDNVISERQLTPPNWNSIRVRFDRMLQILLIFKPDLGKRLNLSVKSWL